MVAFFKKPQGSEDFHQIVDYLNASHIRRHLKLAEADGISTLPTTETSEQLAFIGYVTDSNKLTFQKGMDVANITRKRPKPDKNKHENGKSTQEPRIIKKSQPWSTLSNVPSSVADEAITKEIHDGLGRATTSASSLEAEQGSGNISKTQTKATPYGPSSPRTSSEGGLGFHVTMGVVLFRLGLKGYLTCPMNHHSEKDQEASLYKEDYPKHGRMNKEIDEDENVNFVKSSKQWEAHETAGHKMESDDTEVVDFSTDSPKKDDDEITLAETLVNIKKSAAKDKEYAQQVQAQWVSDEARIAQENLAQAEQWDDVQA
uniref:Uncharacterized protein n=1 Tax=Tanacetum cinerariifolium TaxID=118510 RepID=A0A6L2LB66_TANCI|nr:hypothetical protein [Tanacetum cinerariifolium]